MSLLNYVFPTNYTVCLKTNVHQDQLDSSSPTLSIRMMNYINITIALNNSSLQCYSVLSDILVKNELCIPLERGLNVLSTGEGFICLSPPSKLKIAVRFCSIYKKTISFSAIEF